MADTRPGRGADQFIVRFPEGMRERIKAEADANGRSMNAEIVDRLDRSLTADYLPPVKVVELSPVGLNFENAAHFLGVDKKLFSKWWKDGVIPHPKDIGGVPIWSVEELNRVIDYTSSEEGSHLWPPDDD